MIRTFSYRLPVTGYREGAPETGNRKPATKQ